MRADCEKFIRENAADIDGEFSRAGSDFYLSRNEHCGFLDHVGRPWPDDAVARRLHKSARASGRVYVHVDDDGKIRAD